MAKLRIKGKWIGVLAVAALLFGLLAGCGSPATPPADTSLADDVASLQQQVAAQATRITGLETQVASNQQVTAQAGRIAALETQVALGLTAAAPTMANTPQPTATMVPAVAGLVTAGNTKGAASAKVTITEYVDYF